MNDLFEAEFWVNRIDATSKALETILNDLPKTKTSESQQISRVLIDCHRVRMDMSTVDIGPLQMVLLRFRARKLLRAANKIVDERKLKRVSFGTIVSLQPSRISIIS